MQIPGGWTVHDTISAEDLEMFNNIVKGLVGVKYEPIKVATQLVNGTNYCFICKSVLISQDLREGIAKVSIYKPLQGEAVLTGIESIV